MKVEQRDYVAIAKQYANDVISGKIVSCNYVKLACERFFRDLENPAYILDEDKARSACYFIELLPHIKGEWARQKDNHITLESWMVFILVVIFGIVSRTTGLRKYRTAYIEVARKNAKSTLSSGVGLYMMAIDGEPGAEVYSAATTRDQAAIVWSDAQRMVNKRSTKFGKLGIEAHARAISHLASNSRFAALSAEHSTLDGLNIHCGIVDEVHAHKTRDLWDVLETATGARLQPLMWAITTAGSNQAGICYELRTYVIKLLEKTLEDETFFGIIYTIDKDDDWKDKEVWKKANPNYGVSVYPHDMEALATKAIASPQSQNNFLTKRLNVWVNAGVSWMNMAKWEACGDKELSIEDFKGMPCYLGLDLSSKIDVTALSIVFPNKGRKISAFGKYFLPRDTIAERTDQTCAHYEGWAKEGHFDLIPGVSINHGYIKQVIRELAKSFSVQSISYDPWEATQLAQDLEDEGFTMIEIRPTYANFSEPMKELERLVLEDEFVHEDNPAMNWMMSNVVAKLNFNDDVLPTKEISRNKIDGAVALFMALGQVLLNREAKPGVTIFDHDGKIVKDDQEDGKEPVWARLSALFDDDDDED